MILIGKLTSTANTYLVKYLCDSVDYPVYYKGQSNAARIVKNGASFMILDDERNTWKWDIVVPPMVEIPLDISIDNYTYNTETNIFIALTSTNSSDVTEFTTPVKITYAIGTVLAVAGSASFGGSVSIATYLVVNKASTFNNLVSLYANIEATALGSGTLIVGRNEASTPNRGGLSVFGNTYIGKDLRVLGSIYTPALNITGDLVSSLVVGGGASIAKDLTVTGKASVTSDVTISGNLSVGGTIAFMGNATIGASEILLTKSGASNIKILHDTSAIVIKGFDAANVEKVLLYSDVGKDNSYVNIIDGEYDAAYIEHTPGLNILGKLNNSIGVCIDSYGKNAQIVSRYKGTSTYLSSDLTMLDISAYGWVDGSFASEANAYIQIRTKSDWSASIHDTSIFFGVSTTSLAEDILSISDMGIDLLKNNLFLYFKDTAKNSIIFGCNNTNKLELSGTDSTGASRSIFSIDQLSDTSSFVVGVDLSVPNISVTNRFTSAYADIGTSLTAASAVISGDLTAANIYTKTETDTLIRDYALSKQESSTIVKALSVSGLAISNSADDIDNDIVVSAGHTGNNNKTAVIELPSEIIKQLDAEFATGTNTGMLQTGSSIAPSTTYRLYAIKDSINSIVDILAVPVGTDLVLPTSFDVYGYIGSIQTDDSSKIIKCKWSRNGNCIICQYSTVQRPLINVDVVEGGSTHALGVPQGIIAHAFGHIAAGLAATASSLAIAIYSPNIPDVTPVMSANGVLTVGIAGDVFGDSHCQVSSYFEVITDSTGSVKLSRAGNYLDSDSRTNVQIWGYKEFI